MTQNPANGVRLIGLDFGTTTSSAVIAAGQLVGNAVNGKTEIGPLRETWRSDIVFTPYRDDALDLPALERLLDGWLAAAGSNSAFFGGGALLTGLAARSRNAGELVATIRARLGDALVATADDPCLESWLAFMGCAAAVSAADPHTPVLNLNIGGGTTNLALGVAGTVLTTGCLFVGARHVRVESGTYRIAGLSEFASRALAHLGIEKCAGTTLTAGEVEAFVGYQVRLLEATVTGDEEPFGEPVAAMHRQVPLRLPAEVGPARLTVSGGVGELVYAKLRAGPTPGTPHFGDLGIELAERMLRSPVLAGRLHPRALEAPGRATVYGLLRHGTQVSGSTVFVSGSGTSAARDLPILGRISSAMADNRIRDVIELVRRGAVGGCVQVELAGRSPADVRSLALRVSAALRACRFPADRPLVLLMADNLGKVFGHYVTEWGRLPLDLTVIDELAVPDAQFVRIGRVHDKIIPVSFYGMR